MVIYISRKPFSRFPDFPRIFLDFLQPVHLATLKTVLCCFGEVSKFSYLQMIGKKIGWTKLCHTKIVHLWQIMAGTKQFTVLQKWWSAFPMSFYGSTIRLQLLLEIILMLNLKQIFLQLIYFTYIFKEYQCHQIWF